MKILVAGQTSSFWLKEYVVRALEPTKDEIYVLYDSHYGEEVKQEYEKKGVYLVRTDKGVPIIGRIPKLRTIVNLYHNIKKVCRERNFDVIEFQGMPTGRAIFFLEKIFFKFADSIVCVYWGSDLLATSVKRVKYAEKCLKKSKYIVFDSNNLNDRFHEIFGNIYDKKIVNTRLGTTIFDDLNKVLEKKSKNECKKYFGIPYNAKVVAIGYNGRKRQQHMKMLRQLADMEKWKLKDVFFLLHLGYGLESLEYKQEIESFLKSHFENYVIIDDFLDKEKVSMLRFAVDVFVHGQISDALAGSVKEYLYAGAFLINPEWIEYSECKEIGIKYFEYKEWDELPVLLENVLQMNNKETESNRKLLYDYFSWDAVKPAWDRIHGKI